MRKVKSIRGSGGIVLLTICALSLVLVAAFLLTAGDDAVAVRGQEDAADSKQDKAQIVRAVRGIQAGETADASMFEVMSVSRELIPVGAVTNIQQVLGKKVMKGLGEKEFVLLRDVTESKVSYEEEDRLIEHVFQDGAVPKTVEAGSVIDIKLFKAKGQDAVVVSKAVVVGKVDSTLSFYLDKLEQENIKEAASEGYLFLVQYLDSSQPASTVDYLAPYNKGENKRAISDAADDFAVSNFKGQ